jgi:hypothetical protein
LDHLPITTPSLEAKCGRHFRYRDLIECGDTFHTLQPDNAPKSEQTYQALEQLTAYVLDPAVEEFGPIQLTYGLSCGPLSRQITSRTSPPHDQHASYEVNTKGNVICSRGGAAADFLCTNVSSLKLAQWIVKNCQFDRLYFYGVERPIHASIGPDDSKQIVLMQKLATSDHRIPRKLQADSFLILHDSDDLIVRCSSKKEADV